MVTSQIELLLIFKITVYWSIVDSQHCVSFCCTAEQMSYTYTLIHSFLDSIPIWVTTEYQVEFPILYSRLLVSSFILVLNCVYLFATPWTVAH